MIEISNHQRRLRLGARHALGSRADGPGEVAARLVALHSSDPATVYLTCWARVRGFTVGSLEKVLFGDRSLLRVYGMRRTLWVVDREVMPLVDSSSTRKIAASSRKRLIKILQEHDVTEDGDLWLEDVTVKILDVLDAEDGALGRELTRLVPELDRELVFHNKAGKLVGKTRLVTNTMVQLALQAMVTRARPSGTWISSQYRWVSLESWLGGPVPEIDTAEASAGLLRRWLFAFGPGTETDIRWWTGWTATQTRRALADIGAVDVALEGGTGYLLENDLDYVEEGESWVALLPSLDPTAMGWKEREWYLGDHYPRLFDRNGNAGPTVWIDGSIVGGWAQRKDGEIVYELLDDVGSENRRRIDAKVGELQTWMGDVTVTPRFRSPLHKELAG